MWCVYGLVVGDGGVCVRKVVVCVRMGWWCVCVEVYVCGGERVCGGSVRGRVVVCWCEGLCGAGCVVVSVV